MSVQYNFVAANSNELYHQYSDMGIRVQDRNADQRCYRKANRLKAYAPIRGYAARFL